MKQAGCMIRYWIRYTKMPDKAIMINLCGQIPKYRGEINFQTKMFRKGDCRAKRVRTNLSGSEGKEGYVCLNLSFDL
jgi:hypothetical protein